MIVFVRRAILACGLLLVAGCVAEELVVHKDNVVGKKAMKPFLGTYEVEKWLVDTRPETVHVTEKDCEFSFLFATLGRSVDNFRRRFGRRLIPAASQAQRHQNHNQAGRHRPEHSAKVC